MLIPHKGELMSHHIYSRDYDIRNWREDRAKKSIPYRNQAKKENAKIMK